MSTYLIINIVIISIPFLVTLFERRINFYKKLPALAISIFIVGGVYVFWDILATNAGHWRFSGDHVGGIKIFSIPLEEALFFVTVPFSCIFTYESIDYFLKKKSISHSNNIKYLGVIAFGLFFFLAVFSNGYTRAVLIASALIIPLTKLLVPDMSSQRKYWIYIGITTLLFFIFNYFLTSIPIVEYGRTKILGTRVFSIPLEDFLYNWGMLTMYLAVFKWTEKILPKIIMQT